MTILPWAQLPKNIEEYLLRWAATQATAVWLQPNGYEYYPQRPFKKLLAVGAKRWIKAKQQEDFKRLYDFHQQQQSWLFGYLGYDLKNQLEALSSQHPDAIGLPEMYFFEPQWLFMWEEAQLQIKGDLPKGFWEEVMHTKEKEPTVTSSIQIQQRFDRQTYLQTIEAIKQHILEGDIYEMNFCMEFFAEKAVIDPLATFQQLNAHSPMPFSTFLKLQHQYLLGASPERFLKKQGKQLISQPIKGTAKRSKQPTEDQQIRQQLYQSEKERAENLMIVDLVRNDLARSAAIGSVKVAELFGVYSFPQVHQMISTVQATLRDGATWAEALKNAFPMGSMTGAPKIKAMQLIEQYERTKRGLYSGAVGYITPTGDFDFNVVIRSILYNAQAQYLSFQVGSAITYDALPTQEYEECLLKASAIIKTLEAHTNPIT